MRRGCADQQPVLRRNVLRDALCPDLIPLTCQAAGPDNVDCERIVHPSRERACVADTGVVTAGQHRHAGACDRREFEDDIGQAAACMNGHNDVSWQNLDGIHGTRNERKTPGQPWPALDERLMQGSGRRRHHGVDGQRARRRVIEDQHQLREQPVTGSEIDDASAAKEPSHPARGLPCFIQLFAWKTPGMAGGAPDTIEE